MIKTSEQVYLDLKNHIKGTINTDSISRTLFSTDASMFKVMPLAVITPKTEEDVRTVLKYALDHNIMVTPRGAGTGLAGESLGPGIILDFSVYMNEIISVSKDRNFVRVQSGVVLGKLNKHLKKSNRLFGPDPSTENRCTLGGMIANNAAGAHTLKYGATSEWIRSLTVMLHDGSVMTLKSENHNDNHEVYQKLRPLLESNKKLIDDNWPDAPRNRHGYLLKKVLKDNFLDLTRLFCASEGTLGIILEAELKLVTPPTFVKLIALHFKDRNIAATATAPLLEFNPSAVEIIDDICLDMARSLETYKNLFGRDTNSLLLVELDGENLQDIDERIEKIEDRFVKNEKMAISMTVCSDEQMRTTVWKMRKLISGMINKVPGKFQPVPIIEDVCVNPAKLPEYFKGVEKILSTKNIKFLCFGHAGDGVVHIRPFLDMKSIDTMDWIPDICEQIYDFIIKDLKGTISGEHGDGYLRAPFIKKQYGDLFPVFEQVKEIFDPNKILNSDKLTGCFDFEKWKTNLRYKNVSGAKVKVQTKLNWFEKKFQEMAESCNGCGECRSSMKDIDMCPLFRVFGLEIATTRAKANLVRSYLYGELEDVSMKELLGAAEYCINCKMCAIDCPSNVKAGEMMCEMKSIIYQEIGWPLDIKFLFISEMMLKLGSLFPRITNLVAQNSVSRYCQDKIFGMVIERKPPLLSKKTFSRSFKYEPIEDPQDKVVYFLDTFTDLIETDVAEAFVKVLRHNKIDVVVPKQKESGVIYFNYGNFDKATVVADYNVKQLLPYVRKGYKIVCTEPSAASMLRSEYLLLNNSSEYSEVASAVYEAVTYLEMLEQQSKLDVKFNSIKKSFVYHAPCHLKVLKGKISSVPLIESIPGVKIKVSNEGCCGVAGSYGMRRKGYETSMAMGKDLFEKIDQNSINFGLTECTACKMQMEHGAKEKKTVHPIEVLSWAYEEK